MRRTIFAAIALLIIIALCPAAHSEGTDLILKDEDGFYDEYYSQATPAASSKYFEIGYRVCKLADESQTVQGVRSIQYDLVLNNITDKPLKNVQFTVHLKRPLQIILAVPIWYNEPMDIGAGDQGDAPATAIYTWNPFVVLEDINVIDEIELSDFYDMILEIKWDTGNEMILLDTSTVNIPEYAVQSLEELDPLDQSEIDYMKEHTEEKIENQ